MDDGSSGVAVVRETISGEFKSPKVANTLWVFGDKTAGVDDGRSGASDGVDIRGVQVAGGCKLDVDVCDVIYYNG